MGAGSIRGGGHSCSGEGEMVLVLMVEILRSGLILDICWSQQEISISNHRTKNTSLEEE